ncbi:hypothetical protein ACFOOK_16900 [Micromonospora krabiensis]|uniref:Uncharacterized protein n=1 Tax=Micromonospora krabiensis TaxID=307121 RepID=A0A1C3N000_9ACTN|nr:hypothetical protein [Micromonospora krabiensis]SBV25875.1 hypothetical protein GA0070620_1357 [Micromonospora krabiensis]
MSGRQKVLLAALGVLLVALFVVAVGAGRDDRGDPAGRSGLVDRLGGLGGERSAVDAATVTADCGADSARLVFVGGCVLHVADPDGLRTLVLRSAGPFTVAAPAPGDAEFTVRDDVQPADDGTGAVARVAVDRATDVVLTCPGVGGCAVAVAPS